MIKKNLYFLGIILIALGLCGFSSDFETGQTTNNIKDSQTPLLNYEEHIYPEKSNDELFHQYYLIIVTSLEEAQSSIFNHDEYAFRMTHNAYNYTRLIAHLFSSEYENNLLAIADRLKKEAIILKKTNLSELKKKQIQHDLSEILRLFRNNYKYDQIKPWIKK